MIIAILVWSALVGAAYYFADAILGFLTPGAAWLQANPDVAAWIEPVLGFAGTLGMSAAIIAWLAGVALIALFSRSRGARERIRETLAYDEWRSRDGGGAPPPRPSWRERSWAPAGRRDRYDDDDDDDDDRRRSRRRRRDDDDDDDD